jgi:hypothetical protein
MWFVSPIITGLNELLTPKLYERDQLHLICSFSLGDVQFIEHDFHCLQQNSR